jgi:signal transduction histidine kinase
MITRVRQGIAAILLLSNTLLLAFFVLLYVMNRTTPDDYHENAPEHWLAYATFAFNVVGTLASTGLGYLLAMRRPKNPIGWLFLVGTLLTQFASATGSLRLFRAIVGEDASVFGLTIRFPELESLNFLSQPASILALAAAFIFLIILFPEGRLSSWPTRVVAAVAAALTSLTLIETVFGPSVFGRENPIGVPWVYELVAYRLAVLDQELSLSLLCFYLTIPLAGVFFVLRYLRSKGERRLQMKWLGVAAAISAVGVVAQLTSFFTRGFFDIFILDFPWFNWTQLLVAFGFTFVPIASAIAIFKYRLYDIEVILKRSIIFGSLAVFITVGYIAAVVVFGSLLGGARGFIPSVAATGFVAIAFQPVRSGSERMANRLVYGRKAAPYEALIRMTEQMRGAQPIENILPSIAETVASATGARGVLIRLMLSLGQTLEGEWSSVGLHVEGDPSKVFPIHKDESQIGEMEVVKRKGESINEEDESILKALMPRISLALENMRLALELRDRLEQRQAQAAALQESLRRMTNATLRTRLAFQREVHGAVASNLSEIQGLMPEAGAASVEELAQLIDAASRKTDEALEKVREIARGIFPPLLADKGLAAALEAETSRYESLEVNIDPSLLDSRPNAQIESSIYFCCREAIRRLAGSSEVSLDIRRSDGRIEFEISSRGGPAAFPSGVAMDMEDRVDALGGSLVFKSQEESHPTRRNEVHLKGMVPS